MNELVHHKQNTSVLPYFVSQRSLHLPLITQLVHSRILRSIPPQGKAFDTPNILQAKIQVIQVD